jgi:hypothetical protein
MIPAAKLPAALYAVHRLLVLARAMAADGADPGTMYKVLDWAEILPTLITPERTEDTTPEFREMLAGVGEDFPQCVGILSDFDAGATLWHHPAAGMSEPISRPA